MAATGEARQRLRERGRPPIRGEVLHASSEVFLLACGEFGANIEA
jgi:hypothetical protein